MRALRVISWLVLLLAGCAGRLEHPERFGAGISRSDGGTSRDDASVELDVPAMLASECGGSGCHGGSAPSLGLDLESAGVADRVRGAAAASCSGRVLADPADPEGSLLYEKVASATPACGSRMPLLRDPLSAAQIEALRAWIEGL